MRPAVLLCAVGVSTLVRADPRIGAARPVDAPVEAPALRDQKQLAVVFGQTSYLVVWRERTSSSGTASEVRAQLLGTDGVPNGAQVILAASTAALEAPAVGYDGQRYVVAWTGPSLVAGQGPDIYVTHVSGSLQTGTPVALSSAVGTQSRAVVAAGDGQAMVAWNDVSAGLASIRARLIDGTGTPLGSAFGVNLDADVDSPATAPSAHWAGPSDGYLVAWVEGFPPNRAIRAARVSAAGTPSAAFTVSDTTEDTLEPAVASDGSAWMIAWMDHRTGPAPELFGRLVPLAALPSVASFRIGVGGTGGALRPQLGFGAGRYVALWEAYDTTSGRSTLRGGRFTGGGIRSDGDGVIVSSEPAAVPSLLPDGGDGRVRALAGDGSSVLATWTRRGTGLTGDDGYRLLVDATATTLSPGASLMITRGHNHQVTRSLASDGNLFLIVWEDDRAAGSRGLDILGLRVAPDGTPVDAAPLVLCDAVGDQTHPVAAAYPGASFLVAWSDGRSGTDAEIYANRVGALGAPLDGQGFLVAGAPEAQLAPSVAAGNAGWLVTWEDWRRVPDSRPLPGIWAATVSAAAVPGVARALIDPILEQDQACAPAAAWNGDRYFVAYERPCSLLGGVYPALGPSNIVGTWLDDDGVIEAVAQVAVGAGAETQPAVAASGSDVLVAWRDQSGGDAIRLGRLTSGGPSLAAAPALLSPASGSRAAPALAVFDDLAVVSWVDAAPNSVWARRVSTTTLTPLEAAVSLDAGPLLGETNRAGAPPSHGLTMLGVERAVPPAPLAVAPAGQVLAALDGLEISDGREVSRVRFRSFGSRLRGDACAAASACFDGLCSGGRCCDVSCDGLCQTCGVGGCIESPASDTRCGSTTSIGCAALSTDCRVFADGPIAACHGFGECAEPSSPEACTRYTDLPDGTSCHASGCDSAAACSAGACVCTRAVEPFRRDEVGCHALPGAPPPSQRAAACLLILGLCLLARRRGTALLMLALGTSGCDNTTLLAVEMRLEDRVFEAAATVRMVVFADPGSSFPERSSPVELLPGLISRNLDADGDGAVDIVLEFGATYPLSRLNRFELEPNDAPVTRRLALQVEALDVLGARYARLGGSLRTSTDQRVDVVLDPGARRTVAPLSPQCVAECPRPTLHVSAAEASDRVASLPARPTSLVPLHAASIARDLALGLAEANGDGPAAGVVHVYRGGAATLGAPAVTVRGAAAGDRLGVALAAGDLDGDGADELAIGAPGGRGAVFVLRSSMPWPATIDLAAPPPGLVSRLDGVALADELGAALAFSDVDGDGRAELMAAAPGAARVYVARGADLLAGAVTSAAGLPAIQGRSGTRFGRALAAAGTRLAIAAPLEPMGAVWELDWTVDRVGALLDVGGRTHQVGQGGAFGSALVYLGVAAPSLMVGAPLDAGGVVARNAPQPAGALRAGAGVTGLGAVLARLPHPLGDLLVVGAAPASRVFLVAEATLALGEQQHLDEHGGPSVVEFRGERADDGFGAAVTVADLDGDHRDDVVVASHDAVWVFRGPWP